MKQLRVSIHATPGAKLNQVGGSYDGALRIAVTAKADKGKANQAIAKVLAGAVGVKLSQIRLISGQTNRRKVFEIDVDVSTKLDELMNA